MSEYTHNLETPSVAAMSADIEALRTADIPDRLHQQNYNFAPPTQPEIAERLRFLAPAYETMQHQGLAPVAVAVPDLTIEEWRELIGYYGAMAPEGELRLELDNVADDDPRPTRCQQFSDTRIPNWDIAVVATQNSYNLLTGIRLASNRVWDIEASLSLQPEEVKTLWHHERTSLRRRLQRLAIGVYVDATLAYGNLMNDQLPNFGRPARIDRPGGLTSQLFDAYLPSAETYLALQWRQLAVGQQQRRGGAADYNSTDDAAANSITPIGQGEQVILRDPRAPEEDARATIITSRFRGSYSPPVIGLHGDFDTTKNSPPYGIYLAVHDRDILPTYR